MVVYADVVFIVNFVSTFALLLAYAAVFGGVYNLRRKVFAAAVSGIYAILESIYGLPYILRTAVLFLINMISFGKNGLLNNTLRFIFISVCIEAIFLMLMTAFGRDAYIVEGTVTVFSGGVLGAFVYVMSYPIFLITKTVIKKHSKKRDTEFTIDGQKIRLTLLYDSGNLLTFKGKSVAVVSWESIKGIFNNEYYDEFTLKVDERMIFNTVASGGVMPVITPKKSIIDGVERDLYIAVTKRSFKNSDGVIGDIKI